MPYSTLRTSRHGDSLTLDDPDPLSPSDQESATLDIDRTIFGIPNENDEFTRGLNFFFDPSTGQPSIHSTSEESEDLVETSPYEPSMSSNNTGSHIIYTPQSGSDGPAELHSRVVSPRSVGSSDGGSCHGTTDHPHPPSVSACATFGTSTASASPLSASAMDVDSLSVAESSTQTNMSPAVNLTFSEHYGPDDINYLQGLMLEEGSQKKGPRTTRTPKSTATRHDPMGPRASTKTGMDRAQIIEKAKMMRRLGVCLPCLVNHEPCAPGFPCPKCSVSKIQKTPCVRPHLSEAVLFRKGALSFPDGLPASKDLAVMRRNVPLLLYNVGPADPSISPELRPRLKLICREFPVTPGIRSVKSWTKGSQKIDIALPNCVMTIRQYADTAKNMDILVEAEYERLVKELAEYQDDIVSGTLSEAVRQAKKCLPIRNALQLAVLSRLASKSFNIYGQETLGVQREMDPESPYYRRIPMPPLLDAQLDHMLMEKMETLKKSVLSELRRMIAGQGRKHWFKIYLIMSVLLFNLESVYQNQWRQIRRYQERSHKQSAMLRSWEEAAKNLTQHFQAVCRGSIPLNMEWSKADQDAAEVDDHSLAFITRLRGVTQSRADELAERSRASPETPLVWISALLLPQ